MADDVSKALRRAGAEAVIAADRWDAAHDLEAVKWALNARERLAWALDLIETYNADLWAKAGGPARQRPKGRG
jgi:hypothetical protein